MCFSKPMMPIGLGLCPRITIHRLRKADVWLAKSTAKQEQKWKWQSDGASLLNNKVGTATPKPGNGRIQESPSQFAELIKVSFSCAHVIESTTLNSQWKLGGSAALCFSFAPAKYYLLSDFAFRHCWPLSATSEHLTLTLTLTEIVCRWHVQ